MIKLLSLEIENYRSFYAPQILQLGEDAPRRITSLFGPNAGGKSNVAKALAVVKACVVNSANANWILPYDPFLLKEGASGKPTRFCMVFGHGGRRFRYEFSYDREHIASEELCEQSANSKKMRTVFSRAGNGELNSTAAKNGFGKKLSSKTRPETLLITKGREDNNEYSNIVFDLIDSFAVLPGDDDGSSSPLYIELLKNNAPLQRKTVALLQKCDFAIRDIKLESVSVPSEMLEALPLPPEAKRTLEQQGGTAFKTIHAIRDGERTVTGLCEFDFWTQESMGTRKFFEVAVPIIVALEEGKTLFIDEFSSYIHPTLANAILEMFRDQPDDAAAANLILATHNTAIMESYLERDEIVFVEKNLGEESRIVPLTEIGARKDESFEKRYRAGFYGAIPLIRE